VSEPIQPVGPRRATVAPVEPPAVLTPAERDEERRRRERERERRRRRERSDPGPPPQGSGAPRLDVRG
jgi:hypothetical protein